MIGKSDLMVLYSLTVLFSVLSTVFVMQHEYFVAGLMVVLNTITGAIFGAALAKLP